MKTKRAKANRRIMQMYNSIFKFREPYQVLFDADFMITVVTQKMDVESRLSSALSGAVKPMMTQCSMAHLIKLATEKNQVAQSAIDLARKICERRKCNHWKTKSSSVECMKGIIGNGENPLRYLVCSQDSSFRTYLRENVVAVPVLYINRSGLLLLEDEGPASELKRKELEEQKLHAPAEEIKLLEASTTQMKSDAQAQLVLRPDASNPNKQSSYGISETTSAQRLENKLLKRKRRGNPNPLSIKKKKVKKEKRIRLKAQDQKKFNNLKNQVLNDGISLIKAIVINLKR
ncbi:Fcf1-domain-containing protein [Phakopsora pachyrhizi]|uniref:U three protein 23 n=1 Tax=Phakopsora pachyrhizi TaxID=170000 RepID=A0AAV0AGA0_PHAPC|nr:Fcf1-domain-containing protein [Phakopsora pachyrhizi]